MVKREIAVLRYGHRLVRDYRVTSHCCLVARAFGASKIIISGDQDGGIKKSVLDVAKRWGGKFEIGFSESWEKTVKEFRKKGYFIVHLTMYGLPLQKEIEKIRKKNKILIIIGSQKVEPKVYEESDANIAVTGQPHSEIAALAITLDWIQQGEELEKKFKGAKISVKPMEKGKNVRKVNQSKCFK
ncbi:MAG: tRNA (cytidine(56)-2'-O)-methyltransferase [Candidatus Diapherotrites archaeon]|uniref:tRNA (cytidine(56)-2'-O)-methyltransferase n=1 Tax=Candidatus Iainarchaeum sp. TaxID=3101447 RepID=A0A939C4P1_9ARCH|nr:tRNA (cytidine(56)-2'-O)-methyltransferase [Candidatus Diapherotrites archaeon]